MTAVPIESAVEPPDERSYRRRINAWALYDWANSAFATTILAAVLPIYYAVVAGSTLPSEATATAYWSLGLSLSLLIGAILSPILGTISDVSRSKKRFLATFTIIGVIPTALLILVDSGDWLLASVLFIIARVGFLGSYSFYDSLLPHVARPEDRDRVSARGYAMGYLGGGLLLAINIVMIQLLPGTWGARLSFLSVAVWWLVFSIPLFRRVPEPPSAVLSLPGMSVVRTSFAQLRATFRDIRRYRALFLFLIAFLLYNDAIGTIIGLAAIYGAELGFDSVQLILALLLVQFVGIPFALMFGQLPSVKSRRRDFYLAFVAYSIVALPLVGITAGRLLPEDVVGRQPAAFQAIDGAVGQGALSLSDSALDFSGLWVEVPAGDADYQLEEPARISTAAGDALELRFNGQQVQLTFAVGPQFGELGVLLDGRPIIQASTGEPVQVVGFSEGGRVRSGETQIISAASGGVHTLQLVANGEPFALQGLEVLPPQRVSSLLTIISILVAVQIVGVIFAFAARPLFRPLAEKLDTRRSILLSLIVYSVIAIWGFFLDSAVEFWLLAWMVAIVQGGSQALSRSLYSSLAPAKKSGEFFGLYGVMEKFSAVLGPLIFALAVAIFGSSRPAVISLILFFIVGGVLLMRVNVAEGQRIAREEDAREASVPADI